MTLLPFDFHIYQTSSSMPRPKDGPSSAPSSGYKSGAENTALQKHVTFFDRDMDGIIWPLDTFVGFRSIGFGIFLSTVAALIIHAGFSWVTFGTLLPDPFFRLKVENMHRGKHGSDSESYNHLGEFNTQHFDYIFNLYSSEPHTHLTFQEGVRMLHGNRNPYDPFGWFAAAFEWLATYLMLWPADGRMKKEDIRSVYNGSIFYKLSGRKMPS
ncbi:Caleosin, partial [Collybia nuda]